MLEGDEIEQVWAEHHRGLVSVGPELIRRIYEQYAGDQEGLYQRLEFEREWGGVLREYERITGFHETNPMALYHHRIDKYGPPCRSCGKPLRTPDAKLCGACMKPVDEESGGPL